MKRITIPGGSYCEALPDGAFAVLMHGAYLDTHVGRVELPHGLNPLYLRITNVPTFQIVGQAHIGGHVILWKHGNWEIQERISHGVSGHIFDHAGNLHVIEPAEGQTSQGYRYVAEDGTLVTGDATYGDATLRLSEFTRAGDLAIGQGWLGGCVAVRGVDRRVLEPGHTSFIRANRQGDQVAVAIRTQGATVLLWFDVNEWEQFPVEGASEPAPVPPSTPEEPVLNIQSAIDLIGRKAREIDQQQPGLRSSDLERYTARVASECYAIDPRIGRKRADPGRPISKSALGIRHDVSKEGMTVLTAVDFVRDESDAPESEWGEPGNRNHIRSQPFLTEGVTQFWIKPEPLASDPKPEPQPEPTPEPVPPAVCTCAAELAALTARIVALEARPSGGSPSKLRVVGVTFDVEAV